MSRVASTGALCKMLTEMTQVSLIDVQSDQGIRCWNQLYVDPEESMAQPARPVVGLRGCAG